MIAAAPGACRPAPMNTSRHAPDGPQRRQTRRHLLLAGLAAVACGSASAPHAQDREARPRPVTPRGALDADERANVDLFRTVSPSVVHITTLEVARDLFSGNPTEVARGTGTGFIWDERGHVVTNFHVIQGGNAARVTLADQSSFRAQLVGAFADRDLAVLRIDAPREKLRPIALGSSDGLLVGQRVYAIGNPFGLDQTLTTGIVSALNREIESVTRRTIRGAIQTDAAINPGNSGGPLLDSAGRLIGVNTAIFSPSGASAGIGFAIPADEVNRVVPRLIRDGRFVRPALGISPLPAPAARALRLPEGVAVARVQPGAPADRAGIRAFARRADGALIAGDVITAVDGEPVRSFDDLMVALEQRRPGDEAVLQLTRAGQVRRQSVRLAESE